MQIVIILEALLWHRAAESADLIVVRLGRTLFSLLERKISDASLWGLDGTGSARVHPHSCPHVATLCDFVFVMGKGFQLFLHRDH